MGLGLGSDREQTKRKHMNTYSKFRPTGFDSAGAFLPDRQSWLVAPCDRNRDSEALTRSNFKCCLKALGGESNTVEVHRFGHWGAGWFELILIDPKDIERVKEAESMEAALSDYPVLDDMDFSQEETEEAERVWRDCYREKERIAYIRKHRSQFEFRGLTDMIGCVRGKYFCGYASEFLQ
jgi:hypothetical protein